MLSDQEMFDLLSLAKNTAIKAGAFLIENSQKSQKVNVEFAHDVKIEADIQSEKIILESLERHSEFSILSEERGFIERHNQDYCWIIDPIDGTFNYLRKIPLCCVSIGLWQKDTPILGVVYDFNRNELFSGIADKESWLNDESIRVAQTLIKKDSVLCSGFPVQTSFSSEHIEKFVVDVQDYKKVRLLGSAALSIVYVAVGRVDAYREENIMLWDVAGGIPIVLGAGGKSSIRKTAQPYCVNANITNGHI